MALEKIDSDVMANPARGFQATVLHTWQEFNSSWFQDPCEAFPLTPDKLRCVGAMFKKGGYRSCKNYLSVSKDVQAGTLNTSKLAGLPVEESEVIDNGPLAPRT